MDDLAVFAQNGSSPRLRGTLHLLSNKPKIFRFIPALAGNTVPAGSVYEPLPVHPRACGEHWPFS